MGAQLPPDRGRDRGWDPEQRLDRRPGGIARLLAVQHAMITHRQLVACGLRRGAIRRRLEAGRLRQIHRGVYLAGPVMPPLCEEMAAVLACGTGAYVGHGSAACLHGLPPHPAKPDPVTVAVVGRDLRRPDIDIRRITTLADEEATEVEGVPVTTPTRTILDLAAALPSAELAALIAEAYAQGLTS